MKLATPKDLATFDDAIREFVEEQQYQLWFAGNTVVAVDGGTVEIGVPNRFFSEWLESHFQDAIRKAARKAFGRSLVVKFRIDPKLFAKMRESAQATTGAAGNDAPAAGHAGHGSPAAKPVYTMQPKAPASRPTPELRTTKPAAKPSRFSLSRYVVGTSNRVAHAAALSLVEDPKRPGNSPLVTFGGIGHGKTHLLRGIDEGIRQGHPDIKVQYYSCEEFTNLYLEALKHASVTSFRKRIRALDVLILDDVQFLAKKRATQEEFFHTLNALGQRGGKVVLSAEQHPRKLAGIGEELKSRFVSGMVAKVDPPTREMRKQIVIDKAAQRGLELGREVADLLAEHLRTSVCELEGALNYLENYASTFDSAIDVKTARLALGDILRHSVPIIRIDDVVKKASDMFGIPPRQLKDRSRVRSVSHPRMLVLYLARRCTQAPYIEIGQAIGGLNHSTVIAAERKIGKMLEADAEMAIGGRVWKIGDAIDAFEREIGRC